MDPNNHTERERLAALKAYTILDTLPEHELDALTRLASSICNAPVAIITLVDEDRLWFKSKVGFENISELPRNIGFCQHAIESGEDIFEIPDAKADKAFAENAAVTGEAQVRFYAGAPLVSPEGYRLGTLCVMDTVPKRLDANQKETLKTLSSFVVNQFELRKSRNELEINRNSYHKMVEDAGDIIYSSNLQGQFTYINRQTEKIIGYSREELFSTHFTSLIVPEWKKKVSAFYDQQFIHNISETVLEFPVNTKNNGVKWVEQTVTLLLKDGKRDGFQGIVRDIDVRKRGEEELKKVMMAKEQFIANMSHEIRTPLNGVLGFADLLLESELTGEQAEFVNAIVSSGKNLLHVINDILDYSKIDSGMMNFEKAPLNIKNTFDSLSTLFSIKAKEKGVNINFNSDKNIPEMVCGDSTRFTQILTNLVGNALKFTSEGSVNVSAEKIKNNSSTVKIKFQVSDTGIGIPKDKHESIFERFNQASGDTTRKYGGTGLGLSIVKSLVELQGGAISVESEPDKGTVFTVVLPFGKIQADEMQMKEPEKIKPEQKKGGRKMKILLVEDNYLNQRLAVKVLSGFGFKIETALNGNEALNKLSSGKYDLILMDMQMPGMDGYKATTLIREELKINVPIIAMTAHAMEEEKTRCLKLGMNDYISKPFKAEDLYNKIMNLIKQGQQEEAGSAVKEIQSKENAGGLLDLSTLMKLSGDDKKFVREVLAIFIRDIPRELEKIKKGIQEKDYAVVRLSAHTMKSSIGILGLNSKLGDVLNRMEIMEINEKALPVLKQLYVTLRIICLRAVEEAKSRRRVSMRIAC